MMLDFTCHGRKGEDGLELWSTTTILCFSFRSEGILEVDLDLGKHA